MAELVTGEAVALDIRVARLASRASALLLDLLFQATILNMAAPLISIAVQNVDEAWGIGLTLMATVATIIGYPAVMETLTRGRTLGKMALGLRVVSDDGGPERFRQALVRALTGFVEFWVLLGAPALITSLFNQRGKRLGDVLAGTIVIQDRVPSSTYLGAVALMPPQLAPWARSLELSQLSDELALSARQYLTRFWELMPEVRDAMGQRIAGQVLAVVTPPPPAGVRPEIILSAVLAERRHREEWRLAQRRPRRVAHTGWGPVAQVAPVPPVTPVASAAPMAMAAVPAPAVAGPPAGSPTGLPAGSPTGAPAAPYPGPGAGRPQFLPPAEYGEPRHPGTQGPGGGWS